VTAVVDMLPVVYRTEENGDLNQYWYSSHTSSKIIEVIAAIRPVCASACIDLMQPDALIRCLQELEKQCTSVAFISTPSLYFSLSQVRNEKPLRSIH
jgi:hypothetical protein